MLLYDADLKASHIIVDSHGLYQLSFQIGISSLVQ